MDAPGVADSPRAADPWTESGRLETLRRYEILDTSPEQAFDDIARIASQICRTPIAVVSMVDQARVWLKAEVGLNVREVPRDVSFCDHAIEAGGVVVICDAAIDPRFAANPLVTGWPHIRFYAGAVVHANDGTPLGALCVIDREPRPDGLPDDQLLVLRTLARQVEVQLELRRALATERRAAQQFKALATAHERQEAERRESEARLQLAMQAGLVGAWDWNVPERRIYGDAQVARMMGLAPEVLAQGLSPEEYGAAQHPEDRQWITDAIRTAVDQDTEFAEEYRVLADGEIRWIFSRGRSYRDAAGRVLRCTGISIDITDRRRTEAELREANAGRELAMQAARLGRWDHNPSRGVFFWDARSVEMLGMEPGSSPTLETLFDLVHPDDRARVMGSAAAAMSPERVGTYAEEYRIVHPGTHAVRWVSALGRSMFEDGRCARFAGVLQDITERKEAEEHQRLLTHELNHRVKNTLAVVQALVSQTLGGAKTPAYRSLTERLILLSRAHDVLTRTNWSAAPIEEVVASATNPLGAGRVRMEGPPRRLAPKPALSIAMALHELGTNAVKYGALSNDTGQVDIVWSVTLDEAQDPRFHLSWREHGGPPVVAPTRKGFGSRLIQSALAREFHGQTKLTFDPEGVTWTLDAPLSAVEDR